MLPAAATKIDIPFALSFRLLFSQRYLKFLEKNDEIWKFCVALEALKWFQMFESNLHLQQNL
jgi:hypothetical protein